MKELASQNETMMSNADSIRLSSNRPTQTKQTSGSENYLLDEGPLTPAKWELGDAATEMGLRLGILTEADLVK